MANFELTINNADTHSSIHVTNSSSYSGWRVLSDGLNGFGDMPFTATEAEYASSQGGIVLGTHSSIRQLTIKLEAPPTADKRSEAGRVFSLGTEVLVTIAYARSDTRTINGIVTGCKVSEGNIYEPTTVTATIDCLDPMFRSAAITEEANSYTYGSTLAGVTWYLYAKNVTGNALNSLGDISFWFTTGNTEAVTITSQTKVTLSITRSGTGYYYGLPRDTVAVWKAGYAAKDTVQAKSRFDCQIRWDGQVPYCVCNNVAYSMESAVMNSWKGIGYRDFLGGTYTTIALKVEVDSKIGPSFVWTENSSLTYTPGWMGI